MSKSRGRGRAGQGNTGALEVFSRPKKSLPVQLALVAWRWRWELFAVAALGAAYAALNDATGGFALLIMAAVLAALLIIPFTRRFVRTRMWCVIVRHRLRACMSEMRTLNYSGNLPFILHTHGTKVGESTWLWMRPGLAIDDLVERKEQIAAATWARDARVERNRRFAALVRVDTVRRDPLTAKRIVASPLLDGTSTVPLGEVGELPESILTGLTTAASVPTATDRPVHMPVEPDSTARSKPRKTTTPPMAGAVVSAGGEDVSDYV